jgi:hypothetical protein
LYTYKKDKTSFSAAEVNPLPILSLIGIKQLACSLVPFHVHFQAKDYTNLVSEILPIRFLSQISWKPDEDHVPGRTKAQKIQEVLHLKQHIIPRILTPKRESNNTSLKRPLKNQTRRYPNRTETIECQPPNVPRNPKD